MGTEETIAATLAVERRLQHKELVEALKDNAGASRILAERVLHLEQAIQTLISQARG